MKRYLITVAALMLSVLVVVVAAFVYVQMALAPESSGGEAGKQTVADEMIQPDRSLPAVRAVE